jgi:hypothetical protein
MQVLEPLGPLPATSRCCRTACGKIQADGDVDFGRKVAAEVHAGLKRTGGVKPRANSCWWTAARSASAAPSCGWGRS